MHTHTHTHTNLRVQNTRTKKHTQAINMIHCYSKCTHARARTHTHTHTHTRYKGSAPAVYHIVDTVERVLLVDIHRVYEHRPTHANTLRDRQTVPSPSHVLHANPNHLHRHLHSGHLADVYPKRVPISTFDRRKRNNNMSLSVQ